MKNKSIQKTLAFLMDIHIISISLEHIQLIR